MRAKTTFLDSSWGVQSREFIILFGGDFRGDQTPRGKILCEVLIVSSEYTIRNYHTASS